MANTNSENFYRIVTLVVDGGTTVMRKHLSLCVQKSGLTLQNFLVSQQGPIFNLQRRKILRQPQIDTLFPQSQGVYVAPDITTFDLTLLFSLLYNVCNLQQSDLDEIETLRKCRNVVYGHTAQASLDSNRFQQFWGDISGAIIALAASTSDQAFINEVGTFISNTKTGPLEVTPAVQILKDWFTNDFPKLQNDVVQLTADLQDLETKTKEDIQTVKADVDANTSDIKTIQTLDLPCIKQDVSKVSTDVQQLDYKVNQDMQGIKSEFRTKELLEEQRKKSAEAKQAAIDRIKEKMNAESEAVVKFTNELSAKIQARIEHAEREIETLNPLDPGFSAAIDAIAAKQVADTNSIKKGIEERMQKFQRDIQKYQKEIEDVASTDNIE